MARYTLILTDDIYTKLVLIATQEHLSLGKLFNNVLTDYANLKIEEMRKKVDMNG
jgi:hypothetical protein